MNKQMYFGIKPYYVDIEEFIVNPKPKNVWQLSYSNEDIKELFILVFTQLNQFPLYVTFEYYDDDYSSAKEELDRLGLEYSHIFIPQQRARRMTYDEGLKDFTEVYFDILFFTVKVTDSKQFKHLVNEYLIPYHHFIVSNQDNIRFGPCFYKEDSITFHMDDTSTFGVKGHDICLISFFSNHYLNTNDFVKLFSKEIDIEMDIDEDEEE